MQAIVVVALAALLLASGQANLIAAEDNEPCASWK
jgi:cytochrome b